MLGHGFEVTSVLRVARLELRALQSLALLDRVLDVVVIAESIGAAATRGELFRELFRRLRRSVVLARARRQREPTATVISC